MLETVVEFGRDGNGATVTGSGWSHPEPGLRWMVDFESYLTLPRPAKAESCEITIQLRPHIRPGKLTRQRLVVAANNYIVGSFEIVRATTVKCEIPAHVVDAGDRVVLRLIHPDGIAPKAVSDIPDAPTLAIAVEKLVLRAAAAAAPSEPAVTAPNKIVERLADPPAPAASQLAASGQVAARAESSFPQAARPSRPR